MILFNFNNCKKNMKFNFLFITIMKILLILIVISVKLVLTLNNQKTVKLVKIAIKLKRVNGA